MEAPRKPAPDPDATLVPGSGSAARSAENVVQTPPPEYDALTAVDASTGSSPAPTRFPGSRSGGIPVLQPGTMLGGRYEILQLLGEGGMGAVYQARDRELNRLVALKVIRPELAGNTDIIQRFKQELILAHQVTHRNVIRIYDLGEADGIKFITMEYIEGEDLRHLLKRQGKFSAEEAAEIIGQVCLALDAAHSVGVIHRDLKPQNVMRDKQGRILVMDFGLARSLEASGMTQTGAMVGTMEYMSPEQALGAELDQRSDLFTVGLIFYELLTGRMPYGAETPLASLLKRTQERAIPASQIVREVPKTLSAVVSKCLERDPKLRYQSAKEIAHDLDAWLGKDAAASLSLPSIRPWGETFPWKWLGAGLAVLVLAVIGFLLGGKISPRTAKTPAGPVASLAIVPFRNASGDQSIDWLGSSIAEMLTTDVGQSSSLRTVSSDRLHQILRDLRVSSGASFDDATLRRVADFSNADHLVWGQYARFGDQIRIDATLRDLKQQRTVSLKEEAPSEKELLSAVDRLAHSIQQNLALSSKVVKELEATAFTPSTKSVPALRYYNEGLQRARQGDHLEALKKFESATKEDPQFALAYTKLAQTYATLGYDREAEQAAREAVDRSEKLPPQEKYRITASYARIVNDNQKAAEAYENLARISPDDSDVELNLAELYQLTGAYDRAREQYKALLDRDPKYVDALLGLGRVEISAGNAQGGLDYLNRALTLAIQLEDDEAKAAVLDATGFAYNDLNKSEDALRNLGEALQIRRRLGDKRGIALSLNAMGRVQERLGELDNARKSYNEALQLRRDIGDKRGIGGTLINLGNLAWGRGQYDEALKSYKQSLQIQHEVGDTKYEAVCLNNIGGAYYGVGEYEDALTYFQQALQLREKLKNPSDLSETVHNLGETSFKLGQFDQALSYFLRALDLSRGAGDKEGMAIEDQWTGIVYAYQGRYGAALNAAQDALKTVQELKQHGFDLGSIQGNYGNALSLAGRAEEAQKNLEEALSLARKLQSDPLVAEILNFQGDSLFYRGDYASAQRLYTQALQVASKTPDRYLILVTKLRVAKVAVKQGRSQAAITALRLLAQEAQTRRLKYVTAECSLYLGEALLVVKDYTRARMELDDALHKSEDLGLKVLQAQSHYFRGKALRFSGKGAEAERDEADARRILDEIRKEANSDAILKRSDFAPIYAQAQ